MTMQGNAGPEGAAGLAHRCDGLWENLFYRKVIRPSGLRRALSHACFLLQDSHLKPQGCVRALRGGLPAVIGTLPPAADERCVLLAFGDPVFVRRFAPELIQSVRQNSPRIALHFHVFGMPAESLVEGLVRHGGVSVSWEADLCAGVSAARRRQYYQSMRFIRLAEFLEASRTGFLAIDIDSVVKRDLRDVQHLWRNADIGLIFRSELTDPGKRVLAAALYAAPTEAGRRFMRKAADRMLPHVLMSPFIEKLDQRCLNLSFEKDARGVRIVPLPLKLAAIDEEDAIIVSYRGSRKDRAPASEAHQISHG